MRLAAHETMIMTNAVIDKSAIRPSTVDEINILLKFDKHSMQQGIKLHSQASEKNRAAAQRLYDKGLISQSDGGYLTDRGVEAASHCEHLIDLLDC